MLISPAYAQAAGAAGGGDIFMSLLPLILIFVVFYFLLIRPQQKRMKDHREMLSNIRRGDRIVTGGRHHRHRHQGRQRRRADGGDRREHAGQGGALHGPDRAGQDRARQEQGRRRRKTNDADDAVQDEAAAPQPEAKKGLGGLLSRKLIARHSAGPPRCDSEGPDGSFSEMEDRPGRSAVRTGSDLCRSQPTGPGHGARLAGDACRAGCRSSRSISASTCRAARIFLLEVEYQEGGGKERLQSLVDGLRTGAARGRHRLYRPGRDRQRGRLHPSRPGDRDQALAIVEELDDQLEVTVDAQDRVQAAFTEEGRSRELRDGAVIAVDRDSSAAGSTNWAPTSPTSSVRAPTASLVQLPGVDDPERVKDLLGQTARLTFHLLDPTTTPQEARRSGLPAGSILPARAMSWARTASPLEGLRRPSPGDGQRRYPDRRQRDLPGWAGRSWHSVFDTAGARPAFGDVTSENVGQRLAIGAGRPR